MSLFMATGFDNQLYSHRFNVAGNIYSPGRFGRGRYIGFVNGGHYANLPLFVGEAYDSWVIGFACRDASYPYTDLAFTSSFLRLYGDSGQSHMEIYWTSPVANQFRIRVRNGGGAVLADSAPIRLDQGAWRYMEFKFNIHDSTGNVEVRRDGVTVLNLTNVDTRNGGTTANIHTIQFGQSADNGNGALDDVYVLKNDGSGLTDFLGEVEVEGMYPVANGNYSEQTGSDGNSTDNFLLVDDNTSVNDNDFVTSGTTGHRDTYQLSNLARPNAIIHGVLLAHRSRRTDTNQRSIRRILRSAGVDNSGADIPLPTSFVWNHEVFEMNPTTATNWTVSSINGLELGTEVRE